MNTTHHECDVAIVGAGIGGLATCAALTARHPGISISLFDAAADPGGRIRSKRCSAQTGPDTPPVADVFELGAGRYHRTRHRRLHALISILGLKTHGFSYAMQQLTSPHCPAEITDSLQRLQSLESGVSPTASFRSVASAALGESVFDTLVEMSGYDTLRFDGLPFRHGLAILGGHPETQSIWSTDWSDWRALSDGFSALIETLIDDLHAQQRLFFRHRAKRVTPLSKNAVELELSGPNGPLLVKARQVVCATSLFDFLALYPPATEYVDYARHVVDVPLLKGYVQYDRAWWPQHEDKAAGVLGRCLVVPGDFRKIYLSASRPSLFFYCDGPSAMALGQRLDAGPAPELLAQSLDHRIADLAGSTVKATGWKLWERGVSFWANGIERIPGPVWQPAPNLFLQSDINTSELGWMGGHSMAAEATAEEVTRSGKLSALQQRATPTRAHDLESRTAVTRICLTRLHHYLRIQKRKLRFEWRRNVMASKSFDPPTENVVLRLPSTRNRNSLQSFESGSVQSVSIIPLTESRRTDLTLEGLKNVEAICLRSPEQEAQWRFMGRASDRLLLYVSDGHRSAWARHCISQATHTVFVADADSDAVGHDAIAYASGLYRNASLVLVHDANTSSPTNHPEWLQNFQHTHILHIRSENQTDLERVLRLVTHRAMCVVFSGGGARALAHVGALLAFEEKGLAIDAVGGTSMGALVAAPLRRSPWPVPRQPRRRPASSLPAVRRRAPPARRSE